MKKIILLIMFLGMFGFAASSASAQYIRVPNAAISGHNTRTMNGSVSDCKRVCTANGWCKSFDYHKGKNKCDLSNKNRQDVGLKTNYGGNPYDHYSKILTGASSCNPNANQISLFYDANYKGRCVTKNIGNYSSAVSIGLPNDSISSIKVGANVGALLCKDVNYRGTCETYRSNDTFLGNNSIGNDQVSSMKVFRKVKTPTTNFNCNPNANQIAIFLDSNYKGKCTVRNVGRYSSPNLLGMPNDSISSIKVGRNVYATVCRDYNYGGICEDIKTSDSWLGNNSRIKNDQVSSVIVRRKSTFVPTPRGSTVYTGCGYTYKTKKARDTQCGRGGTSKWIGDGVDESKMTRGQTVYTGCGYTYASRTERDKQCGSGGTSKWIRE